MKKVLGILMVIALLVGSAASAQNSLSLTQLGSIPVTFYDGNPSDGGSQVSTAFAVSVQNTSIGRKLDVDANYIVLNVDGTELIFNTWGVISTTETPLKDVNGGASLSLGEVVQDIYAAANGEKELAIFTDSDGVVTGFYSFYPGVMPAINLLDASYTILKS